MKVKDVMTWDVVTTYPEASVAATVMFNRGRPPRSWRGS